MLCEKELDNELKRKQRIESLTFHMNCARFAACRIVNVEDLFECPDFVELPANKQVVVVTNKRKYTAKIVVGADSINSIVA